MVRPAAGPATDAAGLAGIHGDATDVLDDDVLDEHYHLDVIEQYHDGRRNVPELHVGGRGGDNLR